MRSSAFTGGQRCRAVIPLSREASHKRRSMKLAIILHISFVSPPAHAVKRPDQGTLKVSRILDFVIRSVGLSTVSTSKGRPIRLPARSSSAMSITSV